MQSPLVRDENQLVSPGDFYVEPIIGWRCWRITEHRHRGLLLASYTYRLHWPVRKPFRAHCMKALKGAQAHDGSPDVICGCGTHATRTQAQAARWALNTGDIVLGQVRLWGTVVEFTEGWTSEHAYPDSLLLPTANRELAEKVEFMAQLYDVPTLSSAS
jgi:hypothetical protein